MAYMVPLENLPQPRYSNLVPQSKDIASVCRFPYQPPIYKETLRIKGTSRKAVKPLA